MADSKADGSGQQSRTIRKLARVGDGKRIQKRPLTRPSLPASSKAPVIYVSSKTPFMSAVRRVRKQLDKPIRALGGAPGVRKNASLHSRIEALKKPAEDAVGVVVTVMGTGRAVEKTLSIAGWFEQQTDYSVELRTKTLATVDDVVLEDGGEADSSRVRRLSCLEVKIRLK